MARRAGRGAGRRLIVAGGLLMIFVWGSIWLRFREPAAEPPPPPPDLNVWDFLGCHRLQFDDWVAEGPGPAAGSRVAAGGSAAVGEDVAARRGATPEGGGATGADADIAAEGVTRVQAQAEAPPVVSTLMLFADSVDEYGRAMTTRRAVPLEADPRLSELETRWFTRADTLWLIWSSREVRGAAALRRSRNGMAGRGVVSPRGGDASAASVQAPASAWAVNCHSLRPNRIGPVNR